METTTMGYIWVRNSHVVSSWSGCEVFQSSWAAVRLLLEWCSSWTARGVLE